MSKFIKSINISEVNPPKLFSQQPPSPTANNKTKPVGVALIGCGYWGQNYARCLTQVNEANLLVICDANKILLDKAAKRFPTSATSLNMDAVLKMDGLTAVVVAEVKCTIHRIYDQSSKKNHLDTPPAASGRNPDKGVNAEKENISINGNSVYGAYFEGGMGFRNDNANGIAINDEPESMYVSLPAPRQRLDRLKTRR